MQSREGAKGLSGWVSRHRIELGLSLRMTTAGLLSFVAAHLLGLVQVYWAVLTAVIVMQTSVGGSLKAMFDRFVGTLGGAAWGVAVTVGLPHQGVAATGVALAVALIPLAVLVAFRPGYRVAPVTAAIVLLGHLGPGGLGQDGAVEAALDRVFEIGLGSIVALLVALLVVPARAHGLLYDVARGALALMADQATRVLAGVADPIDSAVVLSGNDRIRAAIERASASADEASRERRSYVTEAPDPEPLVRALRRLSHDLVMVARVLRTPLPDAVRVPLAAAAGEVAAALASQMIGIGAAISGNSALPAPGPLDRAFDAYDQAVAGLRREGLTRALSDEDVERIFGLSFGIEQIRRNLDDLTGRARDLMA